MFDHRGQVIAIVLGGAPDGQSLNFAIPIDYAKGLLVTSTVRPLASVYEPAPPAETEASAEGGNKTRNTTGPNVSEEMRKTNSFVYLGRKLYQWTLEDAKVELGLPVRQRDSYGPDKQVDGTIYAFPDPTRAYLEFELNFDAKTKRLRSVYMYPLNAKLDGARRLWGKNYRVTKYPNGNRGYMYNDRRLVLITDKDEKIISVGVY